MPIPHHYQAALEAARRYADETEGQCWQCECRPVDLAYYLSTGIPFCYDCGVTVGYRYEESWYAECE